MCSDSAGLLSNVSRHPEVERTRHEIGRGLRLYYVKANEQVYVECVSNQSLFVQSAIGNVTHGWHPATVRPLLHAYAHALRTP